MIYKVQGSRVYAKGGGSYNCTNKVTATELCKKLNELEKCKTKHTETEKTLNKITKDITRLNITISTLHTEIQQIRQELQQKS